MGNSVLIAIESVVALVTGSLSVIADVFHSGVDLTGSLVAFSGIFMALRSADRKYAYGYGRYENASALIQFVLIAVIGVTILIEGARRAISGFVVNVDSLAIVAILITVAIDAVLFHYISRAGRKLSSSALEADSYHFGTDAVGKVGVLVGISGAYLGFSVFDLLGASAISITFLVAAFAMGRKNLRILTDASPDLELMLALHRKATDVPGVLDVHSLRARLSGRNVLVDLCVHVDSDTPLERAHQIAHDVEENLRINVPGVSEVMVHVEPTNHATALEATHPRDKEG